MSRVWKAALSYFALAFSAGFLLGAVRVLAVVPRLGERAAELIEMPIMGLVTIGAARWVVRRMPTPKTSELVATGLIALGLLVAAELLMVVLVRHMSIAEYVASRDPVSGTAFVVLLGVFAVMPLMVGIVTKGRR